MPATLKPRLHLLLAVLLPLAVLAVYSPGLGGGFAFDDFPNIVDNKALHVTGLDWASWMAAAMSSPASDLQRPLAMLSFAVNHYFTGLDPWPMKLGNLALHALNSLLVLALARQLLRVGDDGRDEGRARLAALLAAACWALNPINFTAVMLVVQRMEVLCHAFAFAGLWLYLDGRRRQMEGRAGWARILAGLGPCTVLGLLAKESAALLPLYAFVAECCLFRFAMPAPAARRRLWLLYLVVLLVPAIAGLAWLLPRTLQADAYVTRNFSLVERLLTEPRVLLDYLRWTVAPDLSRMGLYHDDYAVSRGWSTPPSTLPAVLALAALAAVAVSLRRGRPLFALGLLWFLCAHALTATFIPLELVFEHRNYFASFGVCVALVDLLVLAPARTRVAAIGLWGMAAIVLLHAGLTSLRAREWRDPLRLATTEAARHPLSPRATYDEARILIVLGGYDPQSPLTAAAGPALERAMRAPGSSMLPEQAALMLAARTGRPLEARHWHALYAKLRRAPLAPQDIGAIAALVHCARAGLCAFPRSAMLEMFSAALERDRHPEVLNIYADYAQGVLHDPDMAVRLWHEAIALRPLAQYRINLAGLYLATGRPVEAREQVRLLRESGRFGQHEAAAAALEARVQERLREAAALAPPRTTPGATPRR